MTPPNWPRPRPGYTTGTGCGPASAGANISCPRPHPIAGHIAVARAEAPPGRGGHPERRRSTRARRLDQWSTTSTAACSRTAATPAGNRWTPARRRGAGGSPSEPPRCPRGDGRARPVWCGSREMPPSAAEAFVSAVTGASAVVVVGTSGLVHPAASLPALAARQAYLSSRSIPAPPAWAARWTSTCAPAGLVLSSGSAVRPTAARAALPIAAPFRTWRTRGSSFRPPQPGRPSSVLLSATSR